MNLILCLDDRNGISFNGRRQSADRVVAKHILDYVGQRRLWVRPKSQSFFPGAETHITVDPDCFRKAGLEDFCFGEDETCLAYLLEARSIIVYRWNRIYPADVRFPEGELLRRRRLCAAEFSGSSHDRITQEIYIL